MHYRFESISDLTDGKDRVLEASQIEANASDERMKERVYIGVLLAAVLLVYGNSLWNGFTMDDTLYIHQNPQVTAPTLRGFFAPNDFSHVVRPVTFATFALNWRMERDHPFGYHLANLLLHAAVVWLLYLLLRRLLSCFVAGKFVAFAAALLFAVHPIHTEAVSSIAGRSEILAAGLLIAAWLFHLKDRPIPTLLCFALAVFSKESAVVLLPLVLAGDYAAGKLKPWLRYAGIAAVTAVYIGVLWKIQGGHFGYAHISRLDNPLAQISPRWRILNALHVAWKYVALQVYPAKLSCDYSFNAIPVHFDFRPTLPWAVAAATVVALWCWAVWKRRTGLVLAGAIYFAGFATTANVVLPIGTIMGERLAYFPSIGICLLAALACMWCRDRRRAATLAVFAMVVAALGVRTFVRNLDWQDNLTLYSAAVRAVPATAKMHSNLALEYMKLHETDLARKEFAAALQIEPEFPDALENYGLLEARLGNEQKGGHMLEQALYMSTRDNPNYDFMAVNLAALLIKDGYLDGAMDLLNREIAEAPNYSRAWSNRAVIHLQRGDATAARADAETARRLDPANAQALNVLQMLDAPHADQTTKSPSNP